MSSKPTKPIDSSVRVGEAAELLGVSVDTLRRWAPSGRLRVRRSAGGQRPRAPARGPKVPDDPRKRERAPLPPAGREPVPRRRDPAWEEPRAAAGRGPTGPA